MADEQEPVEETPEETPTPDPAIATAQAETTAARAEATQEREQRIKAEARSELLDELAAEEPDAGPSLTDIQKQVDEGTLTQGQALQIATRQTEERLRKDLRKEFADETARSTQASQAEAGITAQINRYVEAMPDLGVEGSDALEPVVAEYKFIVSMDGEPKTEQDRLKYQLRALRTKFGDAATIKERATRRETHVETTTGSGGGGSPAVHPDQTSDFNKAGLPKDWWDFYDYQIAKGLYKGRDDPAIAIEAKSIVAKGRRCRWQAERGRGVAA